METKVHVLREADDSMKRMLLVVLTLVLAAAAVWVGGAVVPSTANYAVRAAATGGYELLLTVPSPDLFVELQVPDTASVVDVRVGGRPASLVTPWPGTRRRVLSIWRGPVDVVLARGEGPFDLHGQPMPVAGPHTGLELPDGWTRVGTGVGRLDVVTTDPLTVAVPAGAQWGKEAADRAVRLYSAAGHVAMAPPAREQAIVLTGPEPERAARAVIDLFIPTYAADARWWELGAAEFYTKKLLDQTKLWTNHAEERKWTEAHHKSVNYALAIWLDARIRLDSRRERSLDDLFRAALPVRTNEQILELVGTVASRSAQDHLDRMQRGREPLPVSGLNQ